MESFCRRITLTLALLMLELLISIDNDDMISFVRRAGFGIRNSAAAASSPLAGTKIRQPWSYLPTLGVEPGRRYTPSVFDVYRNPDLTKLLDVGACSTAAESSTFSHVPPLDGTDPSYIHTLCQEIYGMRFVLFDLELVNIDTVDPLSGFFTAQFQLVFHWVEGWEAQAGNLTEAYFYDGDEIETADGASTCGFDCDTTSAVKTRCCDRMWVPPLQVPSCTVNDLQSVTPMPYLTTTYSYRHRSFWSDGKGNYTTSSTRRTWYVGLDVTCPFIPEFRYFPFDHQILTLDIVNPYASRTWLQLNKGFLQANIVDNIAGVDLSPDDKFNGWRIEDLIVSSACGTQETWRPTFLTQDYLLQMLGDHYEGQKETIMARLRDIKCAEMKNLILTKDRSLSNPSNDQPYNDTMNDYMQRLDATISRYKDCSSSKFQEFKWKNMSQKPEEIIWFNITDDANVNRSFSFLDLQYPKTPIYQINFTCLIDAIANLTTPGIRIQIIIQRFTKYYFVKLFLPTCACVAFSFTAFGLRVDDLLGRLTVIVPSAIALSTLQGYVVATDIPVVAYIAPTTYIILVSYAIQLLIALECICLKFWPWVYPKNQKQGNTRHEGSKPSSMPQNNENVIVLDTQQSSKTKEIQMGQLHLNEQTAKEEPEESLEAEKQQSRLRKIDLICCALVFAIYIIFLTIIVIIPLQYAKKKLEKEHTFGYESLWNPTQT